MQFWQKIRLPLLLLVFLAGLAFIIFAVFFNHATLTITAQAPYTISIANLRTVDCPQDQCSTTLAPGSYQFTLIKTDYQNIQDSLQLTLNQTFQKSYTFQLTPKIQPIGDWNSKNNFSQKPSLLAALQRVDLIQNSTFWETLDNSLNKFPLIKNFQIASSGQNYLLDDGKTISLIPTLEATPDLTPIPTGSAYFYTPDNSQALYLSDDPATFKQTLYTLNLTTKPFAPAALTTFLRDISTYQLIPNHSFTQIALLDQSTADQVGVYLIDLQNKTKKLLTSAPNIMSFRWLERDFLNDPAAPSLTPENQFFLIQKRNPVTLLPELYRGSLSDPNLELLTINNDLSKILPLDNHQLIYAKALDQGFTFQKIDLNTAQSTTLFTASDLALPAKIQYDATVHRLLFLSDQTIYSLSLTL